MAATTSNYPGVIDDALRFRFLRHHIRDAKARDLVARAASQDEFQRLVDHWINEDWNSKHAELTRDFSTLAILSLFRRNLLRLGGWSHDSPA